MAEKLIYSDILIEGSITNPDVESNNAIDNNSPLSFFDYLKYTNGVYTPAEYNVFYTNYLSRWSEVKNSVTPTQTFITEQYVELLKDISLNYTTTAEKQFLSRIDFTNPIELQIALPFYAKKIKEIILFYKQKRDTGTFVIERNKIKGTNTSIERAIYELITQFVFSDDSIENFSLINYSVDSIRRNLEVNIDEFVDVYSNYFDLPAQAVDESTLRAELYSFNTNAVDKDLFFDTNSEITKAIFGSTVFLKEIPLAINTSLNYNPVCNPTNPLDVLVQDDNKDRLGAANRSALKQRFFQKYLGTNFYYLSTNAMIQSMSGQFIEAENPSGNLLNMQTADLAGVESNELEALRDIGLFFKPDKQGILKVSAKSYQYTINTELLEPNKIYIFPDPSVYGNVSLNYQSDYPLLYTFDITTELKNRSSGLAYGDPKIGKDGQPTLPYYSRQQTTGKLESDELFIDMSDLFNQGLIQKWQTDIYGNQYAIFKDSFGQYYVNQIGLDSQYVKCLNLDGHLFFDPIEGYSFDYSTVGVDGTTIRSGLTAQTVDSNFSPAFTLTGSPLYMNFRQFYPFQSCGFDDLSGNSNIKYAPFFDCGSFTKEDGSALPDPVHADLSSYPAGYYYYDTFLAAGLGSLGPPHRALIDTPSLTADMTLSVRTLLSAGDAIAYTCGFFTDDIRISDSDITTTFIDEVNTSSLTTFDPLSSGGDYKPVSYYNTLTGCAYVRKVGSAASLPLSSALSAVTAKYSAYVQNQINNHLVDFDIIYDSIFLKSENTLLIDKLVYDGSNYTTPATRNTSFTTLTANTYSKMSNRFFDETKNTVTFAIMEEFPLLSASNSNIIYPNIYRYNIATNKTTKLWPKSTYTQVKALSANYSISLPAMSAAMVTITEPKLAYNSKNGVWKLTYLGKDLNNLPYVFDHTLKERNSTFETISSRCYAMDSKITATTNWASPSAQFVDFGINVNLTINQYGIS